MRISIFIALAVTVATICVFIWSPVLAQFETVFRIVFGVLLLFFLSCWAIWGMQEIRFRRWYRERQRFSWYNKMGLFESAYILEPRYAKRYWTNLLDGFLK